MLAVLNNMYLEQPLETTPVYSYQSTQHDMGASLEREYMQDAPQWSSMAATAVAAHQYISKRRHKSWRCGCSKCAWCWLVQSSSQSILKLHTFLECSNLHLLHRSHRSCHHFNSSVKHQQQKRTPVRSLRVICCLLPPSPGHALASVCSIQVVPGIMPSSGHLAKLAPQKVHELAVPHQLLDAADDHRHYICTALLCALVLGRLRLGKPLRLVTSRLPLDLRRHASTHGQVGAHLHLKVN